MYIALRTIIIEDKFGRDNQYLKGHKYDLSYSDWTVVDHGGRRIQSFNSHKLLSEENIKKHFEYEEEDVIRGGQALHIKKYR